MKILTVDLGTRSYPIFIGDGLLGTFKAITEYAAGKRILIVTNETIAPLYLSQVNSMFAGFSQDVVVLPDGERYKTLDVLNRIFDALIDGKHTRKTTLVALGGGVVGDMTGFAAACYQRGVAFIQVPTTLLAQVDSSVGGKTAVNHPLGKNMIGAFHQPSCVLIDVDTLKTLPEREYRSGLAEVIKYGLIRDLPFFEWIEANVSALLERDPAALAYGIERSCQNKADIVAQDETEAGIRAWLNLGHTFGHAIEAWEHYEGLLHGEAVAIGMAMALEMSLQRGHLSDSDVNRVSAVLDKLGLPLLPPQGMTPDIFIEYMQRDKKILDGGLRLVLLECIGQAYICENSPVADVIRAIQASIKRHGAGLEVR